MSSSPQASLQIEDAVKKFSVGEQTIFSRLRRLHTLDGRD
jgi:hypothetical protein